MRIMKEDDHLQMLLFCDIPSHPTYNAIMIKPIKEKPNLMGSEIRHKS